MAGDVSAERQFAEEVGLLFAAFGIPRMAGRILGWLLVCDPPRQSSAELAAALEASKGSISTATRLLGSYGLIDRLPVPGSRSDHFEVRRLAFSQAHDQLRTFRTFRELMDKGLAVVGDDRSARADRLRETRDFYAFVEREYPKLMERFHTEQRMAREGR